MRLSIVIPVYNEAGVIGSTLGAICASVGTVEPDFEIVCVDDGSADASAAEIETFAKGEPRVQLHRLPQNRGKGAAVREGVLRSNGERIFFLDADLSTPLSEIERFLPALDGGADLVLGNRKSPRSNIEVRQPWYRERLGRVFTSLCRLLLAPGIEDFTCGFKGYRKEAAEQVFRRSSLDGWAFDAELVLIARARGLNIEQMPVTWVNHPASKVRLFPAICGSLRDLLRLFLRRLSGHYRGEH